MKIYNVEFSYNIEVEAENEPDAERLALERLERDDPRWDELNVDIMLVPDELLKLKSQWRKECGR